MSSHARIRTGALAAVASVVAAAAPSPAAAATWSTPRPFDRPPASCDDDGHLGCVVEPAPRVAVTASGKAAAAWVDTRGRVRASVATRPGRVASPVTVAAGGLRPTPAVAPDGTTTVIWAGRGGTLGFARRPPGARARFTRPKPLAPRGSRRGDDFAEAAA